MAKLFQSFDIGSLIDAAGTVVSGAAHVSGNTNLQNLSDQIGRGQRMVRHASSIGGAITNVSRQATIDSRVFIDEGIVDEQCLRHVLGTAHSWYAAQIITALGMSRMVNDIEKVSDILGMVQTGSNEHITSMVSDANRTAQQRMTLKKLGLASFTSDPMGLESSAVAVIPSETPPTSTNNSSDKPKEQFDVNAVSSVKVGDNRIGPIGELFNVELSAPGSKDGGVALPLFVQMVPSIIDADVAPKFITFNVSASLWQRWTQMRAGELRFWKDFVFHQDLVRRNRSIIKNPQVAAAFSDYLRTINKKDAYAARDLIVPPTGKVSSNLSNSVMVFSEDTVSRARVEAGINLHDAKTRHRYFSDSYTMMIIIIDPLHQRVTIYFNGIDGDLNLPYSHFKGKDSKFDPKDFMEAMSAFSSNSIGRMR